MNIIKKFNASIDKIISMDLSSDEKFNCLLNEYVSICKYVTSFGTKNTYIDYFALHDSFMRIFDQRSKSLNDNKYLLSIRSKIINLNNSIRKDYFKKNMFISFLDTRFCN